MQIDVTAGTVHSTILVLDKSSDMLDPCLALPPDSRPQTHFSPMVIKLGSE